MGVKVFKGQGDEDYYRDANGWYVFDGILHIMKDNEDVALYADHQWVSASRGEAEKPTRNREKANSYAGTITRSAPRGPVYRFSDPGDY